METGRARVNSLPSLPLPLPKKRMADKNFRWFDVSVGDNPGHVFFRCRLGKIRPLLAGTESVPHLPITSSDTQSLNYMRLVKAN